MQLILRNAARRDAPAPLLLTCLQACATPPRGITSKAPRTGARRAKREDRGAYAYRRWPCSAVLRAGPGGADGGEETQLDSLRLERSGEASPSGRADSLARACGLPARVGSEYGEVGWSP